MLRPILRRLILRLRVQQRRNQKYALHVAKRDAPDQVYVTPGEGCDFCERCQFESRRLADVNTDNKRPVSDKLLPTAKDYWLSSSYGSCDIISWQWLQRWWSNKGLIIVTSYHHSSFSQSNLKTWRKRRQHITPIYQQSIKRYNHTQRIRLLLLCWRWNCMSMTNINIGIGAIGYALGWNYYGTTFRSNQQQWWLIDISICIVLKGNESWGIE